MRRDNLEQEDLLHRESSGEPSMIVAFCRINGAWFGKDHRLRGAGRAFFICVNICLREGSHILSVEQGAPS
jgi:hypothetical protein